MNSEIILCGQAADFMAPEEIAAVIGQAEIERIKQSDPNPYFRAVVLAHEGEAEPLRLAGGIPVRGRIRWTREAIKSMARRPLTKLVDGLHQFKIAAGRINFSGTAPEVAREVGRTQREINGKLSEIGVFYAPPEKRDALKNKIAVSIEALWTIAKKGAESVAEKMDRLFRVTGWGESDNTAPAFPGARFLGDLAASGTGGMIMIAASGEDWTPADFMRELNDEQKKKLTDHLNVDKKPAMAEESQIVIKLGKDGKVSGAQDVPFSVVQELVRQRKAFITDIWSEEEIFGVERDSVDSEGRPTKIRIGGDEKLKRWWTENLLAPTLKAYKEQAAAAVQKGESNTQALADIEAELSGTRLESARNAIRSSAIEAARAAKYDEKLIAALERTIGKLIPELPDDLDPQALLYSGENGEKKLITAKEVDGLIKETAKKRGPELVGQFANEIAPQIFDMRPAEDDNKNTIPDIILPKQNNGGAGYNLEDDNGF